MAESTLLSCFTAVMSLTAAVASVIAALRNKKIENLQIKLEKGKAEVNSLRNELRRVYVNVNELLAIEKELSDELGISKIMARKGHYTDSYIQPKHVQTRIQELSNEIQ